MRARRSMVVLAALVVAACGKKPDVVVEASDQVHVTAADIDADPVALLPSAAVGIVRVDVPAALKSSFGQRLAAFAAAEVPLPPSAGFDPSRDLSLVYVGLYSMQGADSAGIATGTFHPDAIDRAADGTTTTPLGAPLVKTTYAKTALYVSRNIGFAVLTEHTVLFGDETGIRRALDRLSDGRAKHETPKWVDDVFATPNAPLALVFDFTGQAPVSAITQNLPFLSGVQTARAIGNFEAPGINFVGSLTYPDPESAQTAAATIVQMSQTLSSYSFFMQLAGIGNPVQKLQAAPSGDDAQFAVSVSTSAVEWALGQVKNQLGASSSATPITPSPVHP